MRRAKVYKNLEARQELFGLEPSDLLIVSGLLWFCLTFGAGLLVSLITLLTTYGVMRVFKRGKPPGYTLTLLRYVLRGKRGILAAGKPDAGGRKNRFAPISKNKQRKERK